MEGGRDFEASDAEGKSKIILTVDDTECGEVAVERMEYLGRAGLKAEVYFIFAMEKELPPIVSEKKEMMIFTELRLKASRITEYYVERLRKAGLEIKQIRIFFGNVIEELLRLENLVKPDFIMFGMKKKSFFERLLHGDVHKDIIFKTKSPVVVCKIGFEPEKKAYEVIRCSSCERCEIGLEKREE
jgi:nucleotide-binding universal stress UspA family protein